MEVLSPLLAQPRRWQARAGRKAHVGQIGVAGARPRDGEPDGRQHFQGFGQQHVEHRGADALAAVRCVDGDALDEDKAVLANEVAVGDGRAVDVAPLVEWVGCTFDKLG